MKICKGATRIVLVFKNYVIKIPNFTYSHLHFLNGCYANWSERAYTKSFKCWKEEYDKIAPTVFSLYFGLLSIQRRVNILERELTDDECKYFSSQTSDFKGVNFGYLGTRLVCVDYV